MRTPLGVLCVSLLSMAAIGCVARVPCSDTEPCPMGNYCIADRRGETICMAECRPAMDGTVCRNGGLCIQNGPDTGYCFTGGNIPVGGVCTTHTECAFGAACVGFDGIAAAQCYEACDFDGTAPCSGMAECVPSLPDGRGYCRRRGMGDAGRL